MIRFKLHVISQFITPKGGKVHISTHSFVQTHSNDGNINNNSRPSALVEVKLIIELTSTSRRASVNNQINEKKDLLKFQVLQVTFKHVLGFIEFTSTRRTSVNNQINKKSLADLLKFQVLQVTFKHVVGFNILTRIAALQAIRDFLKHSRGRCTHIPRLIMGPRRIPERGNLGIYLFNGRRPWPKRTRPPGPLKVRWITGPLENIPKKIIRLTRNDGDKRLTSMQCRQILRVQTFHRIRHTHEQRYIKSHQWPTQIWWKMYSHSTPNNRSTAGPITRQLLTQSQAPTRSIKSHGCTRKYSNK